MYLGYGGSGKMRHWLLFFFLALSGHAVALPLQKPVQSQIAIPPPATNQVRPAEVGDDFVIGPEDVLAISVWREPELSVRDVLVRPDGKISLPLVNEIQASGLTTRQLQERIAERLREFVASPNVSVVVIRIASLSVSIVGRVSKPGVYYLGSPMTVLDLLARAGGFQEDAKTKKIKIVRKEAGRTSQFSFNYKDAAEGKNLQQNITLKKGDVVIVP
jgi:polysaccharide export outer membrane protein